MESKIVRGNDKEVKVVAIVLAAGSGKRMGTATKKQYLLLNDKPILYYSLKAFEDSSVDEIILVVGKEDVQYCQDEIVNKYCLKKIALLVEGGNERYLSVYNGLQAVDKADYVLIHDGARPFVSQDIIERSIEDVFTHKASIVGVPTKDTVKIISSRNIVKETPDRDSVWNIQTPQCFDYELIKQAYDLIMTKVLDEKNNIKETEERYDSGNNTRIHRLNITDDAMVVEYTLNYPIHVTMGSYTNIKVTTPEDLMVGQMYLDNSHTC